MDLIIFSSYIISLSYHNLDIGFAPKSVLENDYQQAMVSRLG